MSVTLALQFDPTSADPSKMEEFFDDDDLKKVRKFIKIRECPDHTAFPPPCTVNLFFGFFFDGTNNNLKLDRDSFRHSNVARLYETFPGGRDENGSEVWPKLKENYYNYFRTYIPGVGTAFDKVRDSGAGNDRTFGLAGGKLSENRIIWGLVQAINNVHKYYCDMPLISDDEFKKKFNKLTLPSFYDTQSRFSSSSDSERQTSMELMESTFTDALTKLHQALRVYLPIDAPPKSKDKGVVTQIYVSVFGFSRGAAKARAFSNWLLWLCRLDAKIAGRDGSSLGTIPMTFDFLGLFDTVASVGLVEAVPVIGAHGHDAWADSAYSLKISDPGPKLCLHLVAGHEVRRSFPSDSVLIKNQLPGNCKEIVFPGVHSDVGGGYLPKEQGRGRDAEGADMLSRIALATMYRAARLAGVPLKLEEAPASVKRSFLIDADLIRMFNAYIQACTKGASPEKPLTGQLHELMEYQHGQYIRWRKKMLGKMAELQSVKDCNKFDREDILCADDELKLEVAQFEAWREWKSGYHSTYSSENADTEPHHWSEWENLAQYWDQETPAPAITDLFDQYVHDSRAGFRPTGKDLPALVLIAEALAVRQEKIDELERDQVGPRPMSLSAKEKAIVTQYTPYRGKPNVSEGITPDSDGRESTDIMKAGYLRYRKIFMGSDRYKPHGAAYSQRAPNDGDRRIVDAAGETQVLAA